MSSSGSDAGPGQSLVKEYFGTNYPYINTKKDTVNAITGPIKRVIAPYNPFA